jgi:hypothetical protein
VNYTIAGELMSSKKMGGGNEAKKRFKTVVYDIVGARGMSQSVKHCVTEGIAPRHDSAEV